MPTENQFYFIKFANYTAKDVEIIYKEFPKDLVDKPENYPVLEAPIEANLHSLLWVCRGANWCPIPKRMIIFARSFQKSLRKILNKVIKDGKVLESDELNFIVNLQQRSITKYEFIDGQLVEKTIPNPDDQGKTMITPGWLKYSCRSLLDYLCEGNLKQLKRCPYCNKYFIAKDAKRKICYEKKCLNIYHCSDMKKRRDKDPVRYC